MTISAEAATSTGTSQGRLPDFFIVGHPKSGTTALYEMLKAHPQIYMPELKEPWFFASDMRPRFQPPRSGPPVNTLDQYLELFDGAGPEQLSGEASSTYLLSRTAASAIASAKPDAKIIAILREPASFLRSLHVQLLGTHVESKRDFAKAIALESARREGKRIPRRSHRPQLLLYSDHVHYVEQLQRYYDVFPPTQILVLIYDDFRRDNAGTVRSVLRFLGASEDAPINVTRANPTVVQMRSQQLDEVMNVISVGRGPVSRAAKEALKAITSSRMRAAALELTRRHLIYGRPQAPDAELMVELRRRYRDEVVALSRYLGRDLVSLWGYDEHD